MEGGLFHKKDIYTSRHNTAYLCWKCH